MLTSCPSRQDLFFLKELEQLFCGPFICFGNVYLSVSFAFSLCSSGSNQVIYNWGIWRRLQLFGSFLNLFMFFFNEKGILHQGQCVLDDELSTTDLSKVRRGELVIANLNKIWPGCGCIAKHRREAEYPLLCGLFLAHGLKCIWSSWRYCISPGCA